MSSSFRTSKIPYAHVKIGPVVKRDVMMASAMLEHEEKGRTDSTSVKLM